MKRFIMEKFRTTSHESADSDDKQCLSAEDTNSDDSDMVLLISDSEEPLVIPGSSFRIAKSNKQKKTYSQHENFEPKIETNDVWSEDESFTIELSSADETDEKFPISSLTIQKPSEGVIKRRSSSCSVDSLSFVPQIEMDSDYYSQSQSGLSASQRRSCSSRAPGTIHKIEMKNFMCHDHLKVELNPRINFVIGKNGSGKSAIQTAVAIGLGGKALATNRGSSLKALIKNGKNSCTITIVINNEGRSAFNPETYGRFIKVERTFSHSAGSYKIKNSQDKLVSTERKEVDRIVNHFNIQPENPLCILQQDMARNFLNTSDPKKKYIFYMKASRLGDITKLHNESFIRVHSIKDVLDRKFQSVEDAFKDVLKMRENLKVMEDARHKREKCVNLEKEMLWAEVNECKTELKKLNRKFETENRTMKALQQQILDLQDNGGEEQMRKLESQLKEIDEKVEDARTNLESAKRSHSGKKDLYVQYVGKFKEAKENQKSMKYKYDSCLAEIEKLVKSAPEMQHKQEKLKEELDKQKEELNALKAAETTAEHDKLQLNDTVDVTRQSLQSCEQKLDMLRRKKGKTSEQIRHLSQSTSNLGVYGEVIVSIVEGIEKATREKKFSKKPVGPIGRHINVRDPKWAAAIENFLNKGFLSSFCVDNSKDSAVLSKIMNTCCSRYNSSPPPIICSKFLPTMHNISGSETRTRQYTNLVRALDIDNPVVANCLIDQMEAETVLLLPSNNEAYQLLDEEHKVPKNCKKAFTLTGDQFIPAPNYKSYSAMRAVTRATLLQAKQEDLIRELNDEVNKITEEITQVQQEKNTVQHQLGGISNSMRKTEVELRNLKKRRFDTEAKIRQINEELNESGNKTNIGYLEDECQTLKMQLGSASEKFEGLKSKCEEAKEEFEEARAVYERYKNTIDESNRQKAPIQGEIHCLRSSMQEASTKVDLVKLRIRDQEKSMKETQSKIKEAETYLATSRENASQSCDVEVETDRSRNDIAKELNSVRIYLTSLEEKLGGSEEVLQSNLKKRQKEFDAVTKDLNDLRSLLKKTQSALKARRLKEVMLQRIMMSSAKHNFQIALKQRKFEGKLEFDTENETLEIKVSRPQTDEFGKPEKRLETSSLSGGEKSFSTVCFIMALWHEIEMPFHFMDEFDVFMDGINRKTVIDMLLGHATNVNQQFVFLTPLDASSIPENEHITIHRLAAPRE